MYKYKRQAETFYASKNDHHYLLNISTSEYFVINQTAALIWILLDKPKSLNSILLHLRNSSLDFDSFQIELTLYDFLDELLGFNLITFTAY